MENFKSFGVYLFFFFLFKKSGRKFFFFGTYAFLPLVTRYVLVNVSNLYEVRQQTNMQQRNRVGEKRQGWCREKGWSRGFSTRGLGGGLYTCYGSSTDLSRAFNDPVAAAKTRWLNYKSIVVQLFYHKMILLTM